MTSRFFVRAADLAEVTTDIHALGVADVAHVPLPSGDYVVAFTSHALPAHHAASRHAKVLRLPQPHHPGGLTPHIASKFPHVKATEGMTPWEFHKKLHAAHADAILDPELG